MYYFNLEKEKIVCVHFGDSKAIYIEHMTSVYKLTVDHNPGDPQKWRE